MRGSADVANLLVVRSQAERLCGDLDVAQACAREAIAAMALLPGGDRIRVQAQRELGQVLLIGGEYAAARELLLAALQDAENTLGPMDTDTASLLNCLG